MERSAYLYKKALFFKLQDCWTSYTTTYTYMLPLSSYQLFQLFHGRFLRAIFQHPVDLQKKISMWWSFIKDTSYNKYLVKKAKTKVGRKIWIIFVRNCLKLKARLMMTTTTLWISQLANWLGSVQAVHYCTLLYYSLFTLL